MKTTKADHLLLATPGCTLLSFSEPLAWSARVSEADKAAVKAKKKDELIEYHMNWGLGIRNNYGLWHGNYSLLTDCHADVPDGASMVIIEAVWQRLQTQ